MMLDKDHKIGTWRWRSAGLAPQVSNYLCDGVIARNLVVGVSNVELDGTCDLTFVS